ncbi:hypothetical protein K4L06_00070 [Lysobacter sp. BMK333-48F3]|uniref:cupin domain-containing protein n=1 Tax=Lysobacter sp. BMK333-48F3 TaxID=2867962 RepID=UPI001C8CDCF4|nr:cupin domain-containing protein [Lysobacter sp. BMK333-48F3]MBX9399685.1 hypothetical protein [Lysobacter sp. BMK333-48F3]
MPLDDERSLAEQIAAAWGGPPRLLKNALAAPLFTPAEFIQALSTTAQAMAEGRKEPFGRANLAGRSPAIHELMAFFPAPDVRSFEQYQAQVGRAFPGAEFSVILDKVDVALPSIRRKLTPALHGLFDRVGYPARGIHSCIYAGTYSSTPFGIHMDDCHVLMATGIGSKQMAFWPRAHFEHRAELVRAGSPAHAGEPLAALLAEATILEVGPHDLLYWPAGEWHVAVNDSGQFCASLSIGIYHKGDTVEILRKAVALPPAPAANSDHRALDALDLDGLSAASAAGAGTASPERLRHMWDELREAMEAPHAAELAFAAHALGIRTSAGFGPLPDPAGEPVCDDEDGLVGAPHRALDWTAIGDKLLACAHGRVFAFQAHAQQASALLARVQGGETVRVAEFAALVPAQAQPALRAFLAHLRSDAAVAA